MMPEHDPLAALSGLVDGPVPPRAAFADELRARLLSELHAEQPEQEDAMRSPAVITAPAVALPVPASRSRQRTRHPLEIAAILALVIGLVAALLPNRLGNDAPPPTIDAVQGVPPVAMASPAAGENDRHEQAIVWTAAPDGEPVSFAAGTPIYEQSLALDGSRIFRLVSTSRFEGVEALDTVTGQSLWKLPVRLGIDGAVVAGNGLIFVLSEPAANATLTAVDQETGEAVWSVRSPIAAGSIVHADDLIYLWDSQGRLAAFADVSGEERGEHRFTRETPGGPPMHEGARSHESLSVVNGTVVVATTNGIVAAVSAGDIADAQPLWQYEADAAVASLTVAQGVVAANLLSAQNIQGTISVTSRVAVLSLETGEVVWESADDENMGSPVATSVGFAMPASRRPADGATPVPASASFELRSLDVQTWQTLWTTNDIVPRSTALGGAVIIGAMAHGNDGIRVIALSSLTGTILGEITVDGSPDNQTFLTDNDRLYVFDETNSLVAIDLTVLTGQQTSNQVADSRPADGSSQMHDILWQLPPRDDDPFFTDTILFDGTLYRSVRSLRFMGVEAINAATGARVWEQETVIGGQLAADENGVYIVASGLSTPEEFTGTPEAIAFLEPPVATVIALDPATGEERWRADTGDMAASPIVRDGVLYVRDNPLMSLQAFDTTESIFAVDTSDGSIIWEQVIGNPHRGTALDPARDSMVVNETALGIVSSNGTLALLDVETGEIRWHMLGFQLRTTDLALTDGTLVVAGFFQTPLRTPSNLPELSTPAGIIGFAVDDGRVRWTINAGSSPPDLGMAELNLIAVMDMMPGDTDAFATPDVPLDYIVAGIDPGIGQITWIATAGSGARPEIYPAANGNAVVTLLDAGRQSLQFIDTEAGYLLSNSILLDSPIAEPPLIDSGSDVAYLSLTDGSLIAQRLNRGLAQK